MPLVAEVRGGGALPVFTSRESAEAFLAYPHSLGLAVAKQVSPGGLVNVLELYADCGVAKYVVLNPPTQRLDRVRVVEDVKPAHYFTDLLRRLLLRSSHLCGEA